MPLIHVYFYKPVDSDHVLNQVVSRYDPPFSHCDVQFEDGMASSVYRGENVYWKRRGFKKPGYTRLSMPVGPGEYQRAYNLCKRRHESNMGFDGLAMYTLPLRSLICVDKENHTFCSKHCTEVLAEAGVRVVRELDAGAMTPSSLYRALQGAAVFHADCASVRLR